MWTALVLDEAPLGSRQAPASDWIRSCSAGAIQSGRLREAKKQDRDGCAPALARFMGLLNVEAGRLLIVGSE